MDNATVGDKNAKQGEVEAKAVVVGGIAEGDDSGGVSRCCVQWRQGAQTARTRQRLISRARWRGTSSSAGFEGDMRLDGSCMQFTDDGDFACAEGDWTR